MKTSRIFVSHSHHDSAFGLRLVESLRERLGADAVWYDESGGLHGGDEWWDKIVAEITARDTFLVILSPNALASKWVPKEMSIAYRLHVELGHRLLPLLLLPCQQRADWAIIQSIDFADYPATYEQKLSEVLDALKIDATQPLAPTVVEARSPLAQRWAEEAFSAFGQENWSVVVDKTDLLIKSHDMTAALWRIRGLTLQTQGDQSHALWALDESLKLEAHDVATMRAKGRALSAMRNYRVAIETLTEAQAIPATDDAETRLPLLGDLCDALMEYGHLSEVLRRVDDALRLAPDDSTWLKRKLEASRLWRPGPDTLALARSIRASQPALVGEWVDEQYMHSLGPSMPVASVRSADARRGLEQPRRSSYGRIDVIDWIDLALEANPNNPKWLRRKLDVLEQSLGWSADTLTPVRDLLMREPIVVEEWLEHLEQTQQWQYARDVYDLMLEAHPDDAGLLSRKIHVLEQMGHWDDQAAREIARSQPGLVMQWAERFYTASRKPAYPRRLLNIELPVIDLALEIYPKNPVWLKRKLDVLAAYSEIESSVLSGRDRIYERNYVRSRGIRGWLDALALAQSIVTWQPQLVWEWVFAQWPLIEQERRKADALAVVALALRIAPNDQLWLARGWQAQQWV